MKRIKNAFILVALMLVIAFVLNKEELTSTNEYYITTTGLNVRAGIGNMHPISFTLKQGEEVVILSKKKGWYKIMYSGKTGYANSKYLKKHSRVIINREILTSQQKENIVLIIASGIFIGIIIPIGFKFYRKIKDKKLLKTVTDLNRGTTSEKDLVLKLLKYGISEQNIFHDLYISKSKDSFSQIDLVLITEVGVIIFEVKDYGGWIYGTGNQPQWTKVLAYDKQKYLFQNPIIQNNNHIINLKKQLNQYGNLPYYSVIVFYGNCVLKNINFIPKETFIVKSARVLDVIKTILENNVSIQYPNREEVITILKDAVTNGGSIKTQNQHIYNVQDMLGKNRVFD